MSTRILTNQDVLSIINNLILTYGLYSIVIIGVLIFGLFVLYKYLKKKGIIGNPKVISFEPVINKLSEIQTIIKSNNQILLEVIGKVLEKQESSLTEDQALFVLNSIIDTLINQILDKIMEIYISNNIIQNEKIIKEALESEIEAFIRSTDREVDKLPSIKDLLIPTEEKVKRSKTCTDLIMEIMKNEKVEREVARKCKSIIKTNIMNHWIY